MTLKNPWIPIFQEAGYPLGMTTELTPFQHRILQIAQSKIGMHEEGGQNQGSIVAWCLAPWTDGKPGPSMHWCAGFVCTCLLYAGARIKEVGSLSCDRLWQRCQKKGWAFRYHPTLASTLLPGDLLFFGKEGDLFHVGIVEGIDQEQSILTTIEGNNQDAVRREHYSFDHASFYGIARVPSVTP